MYKGMRCVVFIHSRSTSLFLYFKSYSQFDITTAHRIYFILHSLKYCMQQIAAICVFVGMCINPKACATIYIDEVPQCCDLARSGCTR